MANAFFTNIINLLGGTKARAREVEADLTKVEVGFDLVAQNVMGMAVESGTGNNFVLTFSPQPTAWPTRGTFVFIATHANTGAATLQIGALATKPLLANDGNALASNHIVSGELIAVYYNGTDARIAGATKSYVDSVGFSAALPAQAGNAGKFIATDGSTATWGNTVSNLIAGAGSAGDPSITLGDSTSGLFRSALNQISIAVAGAVAVTVDAAKNLLINANLSLTAVSARIFGDFSNATESNRTMFQTSTVDGATNVGAIPNGTAFNSSFRAYSSTDPSNASYISLRAGNAQVGLTSSATGTGTQQPLTISVNTLERARFDLNGNLGLGTSVPFYRFHAKDTNCIVASEGSAGYGSFYANGSTGSSSHYFFATASVETARITATSAGVMHLATGPSATIRATIDASGNVGIGTSSPSYKLDVRGGIIAGGNGTIIGGISYSTRPEIGSISNHPVGFITNNDTKMLLDTSGNLGLGVTPSAWSGLTAVQIKSAALSGNTSGAEGMYLTSNAYVNSGWKYAATGFATRYEQGTGTHAWFTAPSGTAGNPITFTERMSLSNTGLAVTGDLSSTGAVNLTATNPAVLFNTSSFQVYKLSSDIRVYTAGADRAIFNASGLAVTGTLSATGIISTTSNGMSVAGATTSSQYYKLTNASGDLFIATDSSAGTSFAAGGAAYAANYYLSYAAPHIWSTSATERMRLDASGNLGIGVTPSAWGNGVSMQGDAWAVSSTTGFDAAAFSTNARQTAYGNFAQNVVYRGTAGAAAYEQIAGQHRWYRAPSGTAGNPITFTQVMGLDASGNLLVGTLAAAYDTGERVSVINPSGYNAVGIAVGNTDNVGIGIYSGYTATGAAKAIQFKDHNSVVRGSITVTTSATAYNTTSDARLKENIADAPAASSLIDALQVRQFDWLSDGSHQRYGMVAQELYEVAPEAVHKPANPDEMMAVDYSKLVPMLIKEVQSLRARVAQLEGI